MDLRYDFQTSKGWLASAVSAGRSALLRQIRAKAWRVMQVGLEIGAEEDDDQLAVIFFCDLVGKLATAHRGCFEESSSPRRGLLLWLRGAQ